MARPLGVSSWPLGGIKEAVVAEDSVESDSRICIISSAGVIPARASLGNTPIRKEMAPTHFPSI